MASASSRSNIGGIQVLRFFAAFAVLFAHLQREVAEVVMPDVPFWDFRLIDGGIGVDIFFAISGFIMYHVSRDQFGQSGKPYLFMIHRFVRVAPLYYIFTILTLFVSILSSRYVHSGEITSQQIFQSLLFIPYRNGVGQIAPILKLGWTLNYEFFFYMIFFVALFFRRKMGIGILVSFIVALVLLRSFFQDLPVVLDFWGNSIVLEFIAGVFVAVGFERGFRLPGTVAIAMIVAALGGLALLRVTNMLPLLPRPIFFGIPAVVIVAAVIFGQLGNKRNLLQRGLAIMGDASYALYLTHPFALRGITMVWATFSLPKMPYLFIGLTIVSALVIALLTCLFVEKPMTAHLRRWFDGDALRKAPIPGKTTSV